MTPADRFIHSLPNLIHQNILIHSTLLFNTTPSYLILASLICFFLACILYILKLFFLYKSTKEETIFLEITPPSNADQSSYSTEQLFITLHSLGTQIQHIQGFFGRKKYYTLELVSTKNEGIRFLLRTNNNDALAIEKNISSYLTVAT